MADKKFASIEDLLSASGEGTKSPNRAEANAVPDHNKKQSFGSVDEVIAAAEEERKRTKKNYKTFASTQRSDDKRESRQSAPVTSSPTDLLDEFDYAIDAAEQAKKSIPHDKKAAMVMAVNLLLKSHKTSRSVAENLIHKAFKYI